MSRIRCHMRGWLIKYTGLPEETVDTMLARDKYPTQAEEWDFWKISDDAEIRLFYATARSFLFTNATHEFPNGLPPLPKKARILDFGGGVGTIALEFALRGRQVDYFDPSIVQREFVRWVAKTHNLPVHIAAGLHPYDFQPRGQYDLVCAVDVFEHIPGYKEYLRKIAAHMRMGATLFLEAPFGKTDCGLHLKDRGNIATVLGDLGFTANKARIFTKTRRPR